LVVELNADQEKDIDTGRQWTLTIESTPEKLKSLIICCVICIPMSNVRDSKSELESLGLETPKLNDSYEVESLLDNLKQMYFVDYKSMPVYSDWHYVSNYMYTS